MDDRKAEFVSGPNGTYEWVSYYISKVGQRIKKAEKYDANNKFLGRVETYPNGNYITYNSSGAQTEVVQVYADGRTTVSTYEPLSEHGTDSRITVQRGFDKQGNNAYYTIYNYDTSGALGSTEDHYGDYVTKSYYDKSRNVLSEVSTYKGKAFNRQEYEYDDSGMTIKKYYIADDDGKWHITSKNIYDEKNELISTQSYDNDGNLTDVSQTSDSMMFYGKEYTFNANELVSIMQSLEEARVNLKASLSAISSEYSSIASAVSSNDSGLCSLLQKTSGLCKLCDQTFSNLLSGLKNDINTYINKTIRNEEESASELNIIDTQLDDIASVFGSIGQ